MTPNAKDIFLDALELPAADRPAYLERACAGDAELRSAVNGLLAAHDGAADVFHRTVVNLRAVEDPAPPRGPSLGPGDTVGRYTILSLLGEGGFGSVFLAEQFEPVVRHVALKVLRVHAHIREIVERFEAERQVLAMMEHPGIARVYDAGTTADGRPFIAMEFVDGLPITAYATQTSLTLRERLSLFADVCSAVQHAHQKGVIHRDLKPTNILVSEVDGVPVPKVIDFGIAKAIDPEQPVSLVRTQQFHVIGTPQYMSPEQATLGRANIDTRSDVYSLGTVLYELLVGAAPFDESELRAGGLEDTCRIIREKMPTRPSTRVGQLGDQGKRTFTPVDPSRLRRELSGEVDWIVMKALEKEPDRRYQSAAELGQDLLRFLQHRPVVAGPPSASYQLRKLIRRHRFETAAGVVVLLALVATAIVSAAMASRARAAEGIARAAERRAQEKAEQAQHELERANAAEALANQKARQAQRELARANAVGQFTERVLNGVAPGVARGRDTELLREILAAAADDIPRITQSQPGVEASVRAMIGKAYSDLQQRDAALRQLEIAYEVGQRAGPEEVTDVLETNVTYAIALRATGDLKKAEAVLDQTIRTYDTITGYRPERRLEAIVNLCTLYLDTGRTAQAEQRLAAALAELKQATREDDVVRLAAMNNLAIARLRQGHYQDALNTLLELLGTQKRLLGEDHPQTLGTMNNIATAYERLRQNDLSEKYYRDSLTIKRRIYPPGHVSLLRSVQNLGAHLVNSDRLEEAEALFQEASNEAKEHLEPDHELTLGIALRYARLRLKQKNYEAAFLLASEAFAGYARTLGPADERTIVSLTQALTVCVEAGQFERGMALLRQQGELELAGRVLPDSKAMFYIACAGLHAGLKQTGAARACIEQARPFMDSPGIANASIERFKALDEALSEAPTTAPTAAR